MFVFFEFVFSSKILIDDLNIWMIILKEILIILGIDKGLFEFILLNNEFVKSMCLKDSGYIFVDMSIIDLVEDKLGGMWLVIKNDGVFYLFYDNYNFSNVVVNLIKGDGLFYYFIWGIIEF